MTTANLLNVSSVKGTQVDVSKKLQEEAREVTEIFASMMNQTVSAGSQGADDMSSEVGISKAEGTQAITNSYEKYSYKENQIETAKKQDVSAEEMDAVEETLEQAEEEILDTISEEYGVDEETLRNLLESMGLTALDLLNPKNLVSFIMELTGITSGEELLLDESFLNVMETLDALSNDLMKELNVDLKGLQDIISQMETVNLENGEADFDPELENQLKNLELEQTTDTTGEVQTETVEDEAHQNTSEVSEEAAEEGVKVQVNEQEDTEETKVSQTKEEAVSESNKTSQNSSLSSDKESGEDSLWNQDTSSNQVFVTGQSTSTIGQVDEMPRAQFSSYFSVDTAQIMEQLTQQIKVVVTPDTTSMEMQLNPENLGKIYLNISSEEGVVNAHFIATNEVVKEALETQIVALRENLTQAGVKVNAIEVTIASHEFERNLEQNQQEPEKTVQEDKAPKRRNLTVDSLEELQGVMTEEETLVAQIMRDNGNSVDFTA